MLFRDKPVAAVIGRVAKNDDESDARLLHSSQAIANERRADALPLMFWRYGQRPEHCNPGAAARNVAIREDNVPDDLRLDRGDQRAGN